MYITLTEQEMLGFDILFYTGECLLNMLKGTLTFDNQEITFDMSSRGASLVAV